MNEIEKIKEETKEVRQKMVGVSEYINSKEFQHAKEKEVTRTDRELEKKINTTKEALDSISTKIATKIKELEAEFEKTERMYKIMDMQPYYMWGFYLVEEEKEK